ncbi:hypothetical protein SLEP1_g18806 [Rubroshorea leprosula]|uniref:Uncharacterized protein n=1 Tax=Rubroshorea leprosula TaxID=152421 RepID=A0AAV5J4B1_9ROSI|nr:hypothetical protein SLEP1_g18806 [Rubroshorea leprosula]
MGAMAWQAWMGECCLPGEVRYSRQRSLALARLLDFARKGWVAKTWRLNLVTKPYYLMLIKSLKSRSKPTRDAILVTISNLQLYSM